MKKTLLSLIVIAACGGGQSRGAAAPDENCATGDRDGDKICDADDQCPEEGEDFDGWEDSDGCPETAAPRAPSGVSGSAPLKAGGGDDRDGDGVFNNRDKCPDDPEDFDGFMDDDGCPDPDNDQDGVLDVDDRCPNEPEDRDGVADDDGCPEV